VECGFPWAFDPPFAVDVCDGTNVTIRILSTITNAASPRCPGLTNYIRIWSATDSCGNSNVCSQSILLVDTRPPVITCPGPQIVECGVPFTFVPPYATDLCAGTNVTVTGSVPITNLVHCGYAVTITWTAKDPCGNAATCNQTVLAQDTLPPSILCVADKTVDCGAIITFDPPMAWDLCDTNVIISIFSTVTNSPTPGVTNITRTWKATDSCSNMASCSQTIMIRACAPCLAVDKQIACLLPAGQCGTFSDSATGVRGTKDPGFCYRIIVSNCGAVSLTNMMVLDDKLGDLTASFFTSRLEPLLPGEARTRYFSKSWGVDTTNTVTATGKATSTGQMLTNVDMAVAHVVQANVNCQSFVFSPYDIDTSANDNHVTLTNDNSPHAVTFTIVVCNGGDADLANVRVTTPGLGALGCPDPQPFSLRARTCTNIVLCVANLGCTDTVLPLTLVNYVSAQVDTSRGLCGYDTNGSIIVVTSSPPCQMTVDCGPCISVDKQVACLLPAGQCGTFVETATGVRGTKDPGFCYRITVRNCGGLALTNLSIIDDKLGDLTPFYFTSRLEQFLPGDTRTKYFMMGWNVDTTNTVTASGKSVPTARTVSSVDMAIARVLQAGITCETLVTSPDDQDASASDGHVTLAADGLTHPVTFTIIIRNTGAADLANVITTTPGLSALGCADLAPFSLAAHQSVTNILCMANLTCADLRLTNTVTAQVDITGGHCGYDTNGAHVVVQSVCHMEVECNQPGACRVTGGGRQESTYPPVQYMTHGGQVGAPVGTAGFDPGTFQREGSECIHGNWEVVRHDKGGNRGNFHAKIYDSLMCACLSCPENPGSGVVIGGLCNPDDRICGPEPRRAPANKICFSGIGDYAMTSGNRTPRSVLFRVDIEDRSEPGNSHAGGGTPPPDRHRIRIWILTAAELAQLNNPADRLLNFRRTISCTPGSTALQDGAVGSNGLAVPLGTAVFGLRPPDIDDGGEMDHGNHQIHPMIKDCP
jgi:hypothetical protein